MSGEDLPDFHFLTEKSVRGPSPAEEAKFRKAFAAELRKTPDKAPGPLVLTQAMGWENRNLPGRLSKLRRRLLTEAGFRQDAHDRWVRL